MPHVFNSWSAKWWWNLCCKQSPSMKPLQSLELILTSWTLERAGIFVSKPWIWIPLKFVKDTKNRSTHLFFLSLNFILFCHQPLFRKIIDTSLQCWKNLEINGRNCSKSYLHIKMCCWSLNYPWNTLEFPHLRCVGTLSKSTWFDTHIRWHVIA